MTFSSILSFVNGIIDTGNMSCYGLRSFFTHSKRHSHGDQQKKEDSPTEEARFQEACPLLFRKSRSEGNPSGAIIKEDASCPKTAVQATG